VQELYKKLMKLTRSAQDDYGQLASSSAVQCTSDVPQSSPCVEQHPVQQQADKDVVHVQTSCFSHSSRRRNGFIHQADNNCSTPTINGLRENIVEKISSIP